MKIFIRKIQKKDLKTRVEWVNHPSVANNMFFDNPVTLSKTTRWLESLKERKNRIDLVCLDEDNHYIGMMGLTNIELVHSKAELHVFINPNMQGRGFGSLLTKWLVNYGFINYNLNKVYLYTNKSNKPAFSLYEKIGFITEGVLRKDKFKNGRFLDRFFMSILRPEWDQLDWKSDNVSFVLNVD